MFNLDNKKVWVAGNRGMVGSAIVRRLASEGCQILTATRGELDLRDQRGVIDWMEVNRPDAIFLAAARVGGILANSTYPANFLLENLQIECNLFEAAQRCGVGKMLFLGSSCIYPKFAPQPITEDSLLTGALEPTNEWYAIAKIAGIKLAEAFRLQYGCDFISVMPTNLYGPGDNFDLKSSHVLPALMRKAHEAKIGDQDCLEIWGTGTPRREFLHVDDLADACVFLMKTYSGLQHVNVGYGEDLTIFQLARLVADVVGFRGEIITSPERPDGTPRKLMSSRKMAELGWSPRIPLREGITFTYKWFLEHWVHAQ